MKSVIDNKTLTIFFEGELNSSNAEDIEKEIEELLSKGGFDGVKLDFNDLTYISSAGLRIIVRLKQQYDDTTLVNVSSDIYDIFKMVGFHNLLKIETK